MRDSRARCLTVIFATSLSLATSTHALAASIKLVSWNVLTPHFADVRRYPWASAAELAWPHRQERILQRLTHADADVICLQEVAPECWDDLHAEAQKRGYGGILQDVECGHPFANAVLLKRDKFDLVRSESRSRALIVVLRARSNASAPPVYLANVHLHSGVKPQKGPKIARGLIRFYQIRSLLRRIELQCERDAGRDGAALVLCGDFNMDRQLYELLVHGRAPPSSDFSSYTNPLLPLVDAYASAPPEGPPLLSSHRSGELLDFIFTSDAVEVLRTIPVSELAGTVRPRRIPSREHPSDHLPIGAQLSCALDAPGGASSVPNGTIPRTPPDSGLPAGLTDEMLGEFVLKQWAGGGRRRPPRRSASRILRKLQRELHVAGLWPDTPADRLPNKEMLLLALHRIATGGDLPGTESLEHLDQETVSRIKALKKITTLTVHDVRRNSDVVQRDQG